MSKIFSCVRCGFCCQGETTVSLNAHDQERMLLHLNITREEALRRFWRQKDNQIQMRTVNGHCIFFDNGCSIHPGRPWRCRQWPLVPAILVDRNTLKAIAASCPGLAGEASYAEVCDLVKQENKQFCCGKSNKDKHEG